MSFMTKIIDSIQALLPKQLPGISHFLATVAIAILMFLVGLALSFPEEILRQRLQYELERNLPARISINQAGFAFPFGLDAKNVKVRFLEPGLPELTLDTVNLSPHIGSLIGRPGASFTASIGPGQLSGSITSNGAFAGEVDTLNFDEAIQGFDQLRLSGQLQSVRLNSHLQPAPDKRSEMNLQALGLKISGTRSVGLPVDQVNLGRLDLQIDGTGNTFTLNQAGLTTGDLLATASGQVIIGRTIATTRLNLEVQLQPAASLAPEISSLLELVGSPGRDGGRKLSLRGTLARPVVR